MNFPIYCLESFFFAPSVLKVQELLILSIKHLPLGTTVQVQQQPENTSIWVTFNFSAFCTFLIFLNTNLFLSFVLETVSKVTERQSDGIQSYFSQLQSVLMANGLQQVLRLIKFENHTNNNYLLISDLKTQAINL